MHLRVSYLRSLPVAYWTLTVDHRFAVDSRIRRKDLVTRWDSSRSLSEIWKACFTERSLWRPWWHDLFSLRMLLRSLCMPCLYEGQAFLVWSPVFILFAFFESLATHLKSFSRSFLQCLIWNWICFWALIFSFQKLQSWHVVRTYLPGTLSLRCWIVLYVL